MLTERQNRHAINLDDLIGKVDKSNLSSIKQTMAKILEVLDSEVASALDLKKLINRDPPLAARVLKCANSAYYGVSRRLKDILEAIVMIGFQAVKELVLNQKISELFDSSELRYGYSRRLLWKHSLAVAQCARLIFRRERREPGEFVYTAGLLHDIGIIALDEFMHEPFLRIIQRVEQDRVNLMRAETEELGFTHADVAYKLAEVWHFPEDMCALLRLDGSYDVSSESMALYLANSACRTWRIGYNECPAPEEDVKVVLNKLHMNEDGLSIIMNEVLGTIGKMEEQGWF